MLSEEGHWRCTKHMYTKGWGRLEGTSPKVFLFLPQNSFFKTGSYSAAPVFWGISPKLLAALVILLRMVFAKILVSSLARSCCHTKAGIFVSEVWACIGSPEPSCSYHTPLTYSRKIEWSSQALWTCLPERNDFDVTGKTGKELPQKIGKLAQKGPEPHIFLLSHQNYQCSTEGQKRHQNLAPVLVIQGRANH